MTLNAGTQPGHIDAFAHPAKKPRSKGIERFIEKSRFEINRAIELGLELLPSVNGPYLFNPSTGLVVAAPRSAKYRETLYGNNPAMMPVTHEALLHRT